MGTQGANMVDVTIVMPAYNVEAYIKDSILSVINQTYENWELIIINDGSTDNTVSIIESLLSQDSRISFYHQENQGVARTRNRGITLAKGQYISFLDADDIYDARYIELMSAPLRQNKADMSFCKYREVDGPRIITETPAEVQDILNGIFTDHIEYIPYAKANMAIMYRVAQLREQQLLFHPGAVFAEDTEFVLKVAFSARITFVPEYLYLYIYRVDSASRGVFNSRKYLSELAAYSRVKDFAKKNQSLALMPDSFFPYIEKLLFTTKNRIRRYLWQALGDGAYQEVQYFLDEYQKTYQTPFTVPFQGFKKISNWPKLAILRSRNQWLWKWVPEAKKRYED